MLTTTQATKQTIQPETSVLLYKLFGGAIEVTDAYSGRRLGWLSEPIEGEKEFWSAVHVAPKCSYRADFEGEILALAWLVAVDQNRCHICLIPLPAENHTAECLNCFQELENARMECKYDRFIQ